MKKNIKKADFSILSPLLLFTVFALCVITVLLTGANIYKSYTERDQISYDHRTVTQYLSTRIRQSDTNNAYFVGDFAECIPQTEGDTFFFCEHFNGVTYYTRIYCHDGYMCELFSQSDEPFEPQDGERILAVNDLRFEQDDRGVTAYIEFADGTEQTLFFCARSETEVSQ